MLYGKGPGVLMMPKLWPSAANMKTRPASTSAFVVLLLQGLLEMVSAKIAEWIAEFVEDFVRLNPALLPNPASPSPAALGRSPRPSPRVSGRSSFTSIQLEPSAHSAGTSGGGLNSLFDAAAAATSSPSAAAAGTAMHSPRGGAPASAGGSVGTGSFSSRLQAASGAGSGSSTGGRASSRPSLAPPPVRSASPEPTQSPHNPQLPPKGTHTAAPAEGAAAGSQGADEDTEGATPGSTAAAAGLVTPPKPKGLFRQLVGGSKGARAPKPLTNRYSPLEFFCGSPGSLTHSIDAAVCISLLIRLSHSTSDAAALFVSLCRAC
jgi:hypothetical protein